MSHPAPETQPESARAKPIRIFCSYSPVDARAVEILHKHLHGLAAFASMEYMSQIDAGEKLAEERKKQLEKADIVLLFVSRDFLADTRCWELELPEALRRHQQGLTQIVPIIVRPVVWKQTSFGRLSPLPSNERAVSIWSEQDAAWMNVTQGINRVLGGAPIEPAPSTWDRDEPPAIDIPTPEPLRRLWRLVDNFTAVDSPWKLIAFLTGIGLCLASLVYGIVFANFAIVMIAITILMYLLLSTHAHAATSWPIVAKATAYVAATAYSGTFIASTVTASLEVARRPPEVPQISVPISKPPDPSALMSPMPKTLPPAEDEIIFSEETSPPSPTLPPGSPSRKPGTPKPPSPPLLKPPADELSKMSVETISRWLLDLKLTPKQAFTASRHIWRSALNCVLQKRCVDTFETDLKLPVADINKLTTTIHAGAILAVAKTTCDAGNKKGCDLLKDVSGRRPEGINRGEIRNQACKLHLTLVCPKL